MATKNISLESALSGFPDAIQTELRDALLKGGVIPSELAFSWINKLNIDIGALMIKLLPVAKAYARAPISKFYVGAVALGMPPSGSIIGPGNLYLGSNMEFPNESLSLCVHGEQSAVNHALIQGETGLQSLAINAAPCGYCRQFLYEITTAKTLNILLKKDQDQESCSYTEKPLSYYLPDAFEFQNSDQKEKGLMTAESHHLSITNKEALAQAALGGANASYAPYTKDYCGVALMGENNQIYTGRYAENVAYNPSMSPMESALAYMNMNLPAQANLKITAASLVEVSNSISQKDVTEAVLSSVAPSVNLDYILAK